MLNEGLLLLHAIYKRITRWQIVTTVYRKSDWPWNLGLRLATLVVLCVLAATIFVKEWQALESVASARAHALQEARRR
jgi:hypothetical protein